MNNKVAIYPGTFDPITLGHIDIIKRASLLVDRLVIGVAINRDKSPLFNLDERVQMIEAECSGLSSRTGTEIIAHPFENLLIDCAKDVNASVIFRGLRAVADFEYEFQMAGINTRLSNEFETIFLMASENQQFVASRLVKEIHSLGGDVSSFVPEVVLKHLENKK